MKEYTNNEVANEVAEPQAVYSCTPEEVLLHDGLSAEELRRIEKSKAQIALGMVIDDDEVKRKLRKRLFIRSNKQKPL
mgnify:FL=1